MRLQPYFCIREMLGIPSDNAEFARGQTTIPRVFFAASFKSLFVAKVMWIRNDGLSNIAL